MTNSELPPVPWQFTGQPELYHMAVRLYLDTVVERAIENATPRSPTIRDVVGVLQQDTRTLKAAKERGEPL